MIDETKPADEQDDDALTEEDLEAVAGGIGQPGFLNPVLGEAGIGEAG